MRRRVLVSLIKVEVMKREMCFFRDCYFCARFFGAFWGKKTNFLINVIKEIFVYF